MSLVHFNKQYEKLFFLRIFSAKGDQGCFHRHLRFLVAMDNGNAITPLRRLLPARLSAQHSSGSVRLLQHIRVL